LLSGSGGGWKCWDGTFDETGHKLTPESSILTIKTETETETETEIELKLKLKLNLKLKLKFKLKL